MSDYENLNHVKIKTGDRIEIAGSDTLAVYQMTIEGSIGGDGTLITYCPVMVGEPEPTVQLICRYFLPEYGTFKATAISEKVIRCTWSPRSDATAEIERQKSDGSWTTIATGLTGSYYDDTSADPNCRTNYRFRFNSFDPAPVDPAWLTVISHRATTLADLTIIRQDSPTQTSAYSIIELDDPPVSGLFTILWLEVGKTGITIQNDPEIHANVAILCQLETRWWYTIIVNNDEEE